MVVAGWEERGGRGGRRRVGQKRWGCNRCQPRLAHTAAAALPAMGFSTGPPGRQAARLQGGQRAGPLAPEPDIKAVAVQRGAAAHHAPPTCTAAKPLSARGDTRLRCQSHRGGGAVARWRAVAITTLRAGIADGGDIGVKGEFARGGGQMRVAGSICSLDAGGRAGERAPMSVWQCFNGGRGSRWRAAGASACPGRRRMYGYGHGGAAMLAKRAPRRDQTVWSQSEEGGCVVNASAGGSPRPRAAGHRATRGTRTETQLLFRLRDETGARHRTRLRCGLDAAAGRAARLRGSAQRAA